ncbi:hypothetical protein Ahy_B02g057644 [Arachis hypogaea]|uniref:Reverse transcriptase zinc-binding domain-containing protein n=1 Tax=Arachis hypogaea TaxID=3818 RepID=A0A445ACB6_ARAHY|nr:hypothetical protein Ahy_B02g057644 [Arachis hypogaea]
MGAKSQSSQQLCCPGEWDVDKLRRWLPDPVVNRILTISPPSPKKGTADHLFKLAWKWNGPERIRSFIWLVAHETILTNTKRKRRHLTIDARCHQCNFVTEDALHVLRNCSSATIIWNLLQAN